MYMKINSIIRCSAFHLRRHPKLEDNPIVGWPEIGFIRLADKRMIWYP